MDIDLQGQCSHVLLTQFVWAIAKSCNSLFFCKSSPSSCRFRKFYFKRLSIAEFKVSQKPVQEQSKSYFFLQKLISKYKFGLSSYRRKNFSWSIIIDKYCNTNPFITIFSESQRIIWNLKLAMWIWIFSFVLRKIKNFTISFN